MKKNLLYLFMGFALVITLSMFSCEDPDDDAPTAVIQFDCTIDGVVHTYTHVLGDTQYSDTYNGVVDVYNLNGRRWHVVYDELQANCEN